MKMHIPMLLEYRYFFHDSAIPPSRLHTVEPVLFSQSYSSHRSPFTRETERQETRPGLSILGGAALDGPGSTGRGEMWASSLSLNTELRREC